MRYLFGLSASAQAGQEAQAGEEHSLSFWHDEALKIALFSSSPPPPPRTPDGYTLEEMELRVNRAGIELSVSSVAFLVGGVMGISAVMASPVRFCLSAASSGSVSPAASCAGASVTGTA